MVRAVVALWLVAGGVACAPLPPRGTAPLDEARGLPRPVLLPIEGADRLWLHAAVQAGGAFDPMGREGLSALATASLAGMEVPGLAADALGEVRHRRGPELVELSFSCPAAQAEACALALADALVEASEGAPPLLQVRPQLLLERIALLDDPVRLAEAALQAWIYEGHAYGHPWPGRLGTLELATAGEVQGFARTHLSRVNTVIGLAGAFAPELVHVVEARLAALPAERRVDHPMFRPAKIEAGGLLRVEGLGPVAVRAGRAVALHPDHPDHLALLLGLAALGPEGGEAGALALSVPQLHASDWTLPDAGARHPSFVLALGGEAPTPERVAAVLAALAAGASPTAERVEAARAALAQRLSHRPEALLGSAVRATLAGRPDALHTLPQALGVLTVEAAQAAVRQHLSPASLRVVVAGEGAASWPALAPFGEPATHDRTAYDLFR